MSERTIFRDLNALELAGVPYYFDKETSGYRIAGDYFLPPLQLTLPEALALSVLTSQLARQRQIPFLQEAWQAMIKVRGQLPAGLRDVVADADEHIHVQAARSSPQAGQEDYFHVIRLAIAARRKLRCTYDSGEIKPATFLLHPYALYFGQRAWYVIGHSERRGGERSLKLNRILALEQTDRAYAIPDGWTLQASLGYAWRMMRGTKRYHVAVRFDSESARAMADTLWHPTQRITRNARDGSCVFECDVDGLDEIVWWVLGYGPRAVVLRPTELRKWVRDLVVRTARQYGSRRS